MTLADKLDHMPTDDETPAERFRQALALFDDGVDLQRMKLRRRHPEYDDALLEELLLRWLSREDTA
jgi:SHS2 domain-containing protein